MSDPLSLVVALELTQDKEIQAIIAISDVLNSLIGDDKVARRRVLSYLYDKEVGDE